jgi:hypothetical protein
MSVLTTLALLTVLQVSAPASPQTGSLAADPTQLASATTNEARFDVLTGLLKARGILFTVKP